MDTEWMRNQRNSARGYVEPAAHRKSIQGNNILVPTVSQSYAGAAMTGCRKATEKITNERKDNGEVVL